MSEILQKIDDNLALIENRLLEEFFKIQGRESESGYGEIELELKLQIQDALVKLRNRLDTSGEAGRLELTTEYHEMLRARIFVLSRLLLRKIPTNCLQDVQRPAFRSREPGSGGPGAARAGTSTSRTGATITKHTVIEDRAASRSSFLQFFKRKFDRDKDGRTRVRMDTVEPGEKKEIYSATGIYAAAQQLAALASVVSQHQEREAAAESRAAQQSAYQKAKGKATFDSREISTLMPTKARDIARSPEEIRKKLEARRAAAEGGPRASFSGVDINNPLDEITAKEEPKKETPKKDLPPQERAQFVAKDLDHMSTSAEDMKHRFPRRDEQQKKPD